MFGVGKRKLSYKISFLSNWMRLKIRNIDLSRNHLMYFNIIVLLLCTTTLFYSSYILQYYCTPLMYYNIIVLLLCTATLLYSSYLLKHWCYPLFPLFSKVAFRDYLTISSITGGQIEQFFSVF